MQLNDLADELGVNVTLVKNFLRAAGFARADRNFAGSDASLDRREVRAVREAHVRGELKRDRGRTLDSDRVSLPDAVISAEDVLNLPVAQVLDRLPGTRSTPRFRLFAHQDVLDWLAASTTPPDQRRVFTRRVHELMAYGRATRMKGVRGANAGWLRTPIGGNSGSHHYLWLSNSGEPIHRQADATKTLHDLGPRDARFLRAVRHHDDTHDRLGVGSFEDYVELQPESVLRAEEDGLEDPLVDCQKSVVQDRSRVRILVGQPGAGKTTSLQLAASRLQGRALYVTWSYELATRAKQWFAAFETTTLEVVVVTYRELLARLDPRRASSEELGLPDAVALLRERLEPYSGQLSAWRRDGQLQAEALFSEMHAHLVGSALPVAFRGRGACTEACLSDADYRSMRAKLSKNALDAAILAHTRLSIDDRRRLFPGATLAFDVAYSLQNGDVSVDPEMLGFDWVLVDEAQDLTLVEAWLLIDFAARAGAARGVNPGMLIAGDEAQTVRPTAFEFGPLSDMVSERLHARTDRRQHDLVENLRSPEAISSMLNRMRDVLYGSLPRTQRPRGQRSSSPTDVTVGRVMHVEVTDDDALRRVFELFAVNLAEAALVYPTGIVPETVARIASEFEVPVWTSETIKGLEFRIVGVLGVPVELARIEALVAGATRDHVSIELARTAIDRLVVACSRTTETLVLLGTGWGEQGTTAHSILTGRQSPAETVAGEEPPTSDGFLGSVSPDVLAKVLEVDASDAVFQIDSLLTQSERLGESGEFEAALALAENAFGLLGHAGRPGAAGGERRRRTHRRLAQAAVLCGLNRNRPELLQRAARSYRDAELGDLGSLVTSLAYVTRRRFVEPEVCKRLESFASGFSVLTSAEPSIVPWILRAVRDYCVALESSADLPGEPQARAALIRALDSLAKNAPSDRESFRRVHQSVVSRCLAMLVKQREKSRRAEFIALRQLLDDAAARTAFDAEHAEACGELAVASASWESIGRLDDALRCARVVADFTSSARIAAQTGHPSAARLAWAESVTALLRQPPAGVLGGSEIQAIRELVDAALRGSSNVGVS